jgi:eukaryotic-like serine/threonine-protein kinase
MKRMTAMLAPDTLLSNHYRIVRLIAEGGMGAVYEAKALRLASTIALKQMLVSGVLLSQAFEADD